MYGGIRYAAEESRDLEDLEEIKKVDRESLERFKSDLSARNFSNRALSEPFSRLSLSYLIIAIPRQFLN